MKSMRWDILMACLNGPRIFRKYREGNLVVPQEDAGGAYRTNFVEDKCGIVVNVIETCWTIILYTTPFLAISSSFRRTILGMNPEFALKLALGVAFVYGGAYLGRGFGRAFNKEYLAFLHVLLLANQRNDNGTIRNLRTYDFDFRYWPVNYKWRDVDNFGEKVHPRRFLPDYRSPADEGFIKRTLMDGLAYVVVHTIARRIAYPGTLALLQSALKPALDQGRTKLVEQMNGQRFKLQTRTGNDIDSMFVDRRNNDKFPYGNVLVVTCEGNGGFYEAGSAATPLEAGYSVLMWNHPGFGGSTGVPWPSEEAAAVDVVVQFALNQLGWDEGDIIMYGWSIGGYTATWAAMNYRNIHGLILDATFDDIVPLALNAMPKSWAPLVSRTMLTYFNLHVEKQLAEYGGPVCIIRRLKDEVMAAVEGASDAEMMRKKNTANKLLKGILVDRFPNIFHDDILEVIDQWLAATETERIGVYLQYGVGIGDWKIECRNALKEFLARDTEKEQSGAGPFPVLIGADYDVHMRQKMALYLASSYLVEFDSGHNTPLPADKFFIPKQPWE